MTAGGSNVVLADVQASIATVLKPPANFEQIYQGVPRTTPIPLVAADPINGEFRPLDAFAGKAGVASNLARFVRVPFGATLYLLLPIVLNGDTETTAYEYELRWRLRTLADWDRSVEGARFDHPWQLVTSRGAPAPTGAAGATEQLSVMPSFVSEVLTPSRMGGDDRVLVGASAFGTSSQGIYTPTGAGDAAMNAALGPLCYPPSLLVALGNELSICVRGTDEGSWDFSDYAIDGSFSDLYGTNVAGTAHPAYPGVGAFLCSMSRDSAP